MRNRKFPPPRANRIGPNRPSGRLLLTGLPILTAGAAAYAAVAADYMLNVPSLPTLPLACFPAPYPPAPSPRGKGRFMVISCKGLRPLHPRG